MHLLHQHEQHPLLLRHLRLLNQGNQELNLKSARWENSRRADSLFGEDTGEAITRLLPREIPFKHTKVYAKKEGLNPQTPQLAAR